jgi:hypothetical protein
MELKKVWDPERTVYEVTAIYGGKRVDYMGQWYGKREAQKVAKDLNKRRPEMQARAQPKVIKAGWKWSGVIQL